MKKQFKNLENSSTGEIILKYLEQYIYNHPEGWYQWKKYPAMEQLPLSVAVKEKPSYAPQLRPSFGKAA
jgi:hypothetical protein